MKSDRPARKRTVRKRSASPKSEHVIDLSGPKSTKLQTPVEVRGWLSLLVLQLVLVVPVTYVKILVTQSADLPHLWRINPSRYYVGLADLILSGVLVAAACYAGVALLRRRRDAVRFTKGLVIATGIYVLISTAVLAVMVAGRTDISPGQVVGGAVPRLLFLAAVFAYLSKSKRVRATYELVPRGTFPQFEESGGVLKFVHGSTWILASLWAISTVLTLWSLTDQNSIFRELMEADASAQRSGRVANQAREFLGDVDDVTLLSAFEERRVSPSRVGMPRADYLVTMLKRRCVEGEAMVEQVLAESMRLGWSKGPLTLAEELINTTASGERGVRCLERL